MTFQIAEIVVSHTYHYQPDEYLAYCNDVGEEPSEQGFFAYILPEVNADFPGTDWHPYRVVKTTDSERQNDSEALDAVAALLNAEQWSSDHLSAIADLVRATGRTIADV